MSSRLILNGFRSIEECLKFHPERIARLLISPDRRDVRVERLRELALKKKVLVEANPKYDPEEPVLALLHDYQYINFDLFLGELKKSLEQKRNPVVLALDGITDSHNLGAILRTAAFMGIAGVLLPRDRSVQINDAVYRIASGGMEHVPISQVTNLVLALKSLKEIGFWVVGLSEHATQSIHELKRDFSPVLVIGNEEKGMRSLVKENCDYLVKLANKGPLASLNASVAAALAMTWAVF